MPFGEKIQCYLCEKEDSLMWHKSDKGVKCNECQEEIMMNEASEDQEQKFDDYKSKNPMKIIRSYKTRQNSASAPKTMSNRSKSRRGAVFKKKVPYKSPAARATIVALQQCYHQGEHFTVGDVVSVIGQDGQIYFAQLTSLMQDEYSQKCCTITWLLPTLPLWTEPHHRRDVFEPMHYILGPEETTPRTLDWFSFVMHCPGDYWRMESPFPMRAPNVNDADFTWTRLYGDRAPTDDQCRCL